MAHRLADNEIQLRVVATRLRWPKTGMTIAWTKLHDAVDALHGLIRVVDDSCAQAEQNRDFSPEGMKFSI